ncbi:YfaA protein [Gracilibacillus boraciitolerans JCM 21714]|uniref:YfaA protein n=1 Tax=Gracilibacillus boraciitolerans JCM 21714 TaxID=1298598 RepID=W4VMW5_9BACI|nr:YpmS family protein [Gracilibacillus boraciitolerans]GAE94527.1 YfaA protein [Gracilibacillus boraciitolerans JCM 21714]
MKESQITNWKKMFITLIVVNSVIFLGILLFIFWPAPDVEIPEKVFLEDESGAEFTVKSSKTNLNELVNAYIDKLPKPGNIQYAVKFDEEVHLMGTVAAFSTEVPVTISFEPIVQENGDIILHATGMSLGLLRLPEDRILQYVNSRIETPEWITIDPKEEQIYIALTKMELKSNFRVRAQQIDLENDNISFRIKVPNKTLGL